MSLPKKKKVLGSLPNQAQGVGVMGSRVTWVQAPLAILQWVNNGEGRVWQPSRGFICVEIGPCHQLQPREPGQP